MTKLIVAIFCVIGLRVASVYASADEITTSELKGLCDQSIPACEIYLRGVFDGVLQTSKMDQTQIICPESSKTPAQLREYFIHALAFAGDKYDQDRAKIRTGSVIEGTVSFLAHLRMIGNGQRQIRPRLRENPN